jgi:hypothetical protein
MWTTISSPAGVALERALDELVQRLAPRAARYKPPVARTQEQMLGESPLADRNGARPAGRACVRPSCTARSSQADGGRVVRQSCLWRRCWGSLMGARPATRATAQVQRWAPDTLRCLYGECIGLLRRRRQRRKLTACVKSEHTAVCCWTVVVVLDSK